MLADSQNTTGLSNPEDHHLYSHHHENHNLTTSEASDHALSLKKD
jgi:hypothetical protein